MPLGRPAWDFGDLLPIIYIPEQKTLFFIKEIREGFTPFQIPQATPFLNLEAAFERSVNWKNVIVPTSFAHPN